MSHPMVTFADGVAATRTLPSLAPCPCATNIRALAIDLIDKLTIIPSEQMVDLGYSGLAEQDAVYALQTNLAWANWPNPGQVPPTDDAWTAGQSRTARNPHTANNYVTIWNRTSDEQSMQRSTEPSRAYFAGYQEAGWEFNPSAQPTIQK